MVSGLVVPISTQIVWPIIQLKFVADGLERFPAAQVRSLRMCWSVPTSSEGTLLDLLSTARYEGHVSL
jgi:hypothetical protein